MNDCFLCSLIYDQSASENAEVSLINKLKQNCGFEYTSKLTKMITDMQLSKVSSILYSKIVFIRSISI